MLVQTGEETGSADRSGGLTCGILFGQGFLFVYFFCIFFISFHFIFLASQTLRDPMAVEQENISRAMNTLKIPKSHAIQRTAATIMLFGPLSSSSTVGQRTGE
jgi:uncharacterized membrane protein